MTTRAEGGREEMVDAKDASSGISCTVAMVSVVSVVSVEVEMEVEVKVGEISGAKIMCDLGGFYY